MLAAVVLFAVRGLIDVPALRRLYKVSRMEFRISMVALIGVLLPGILKGVLLAAVVSLLMLITVAARPHVPFLGRIPGSRRFSDADRHPDNETVPGILVFRVEASLLYFNVDHVREIVWKKIQSTNPLRLVICDLSNAPQCDVARARVLSRLQRDLAERGVRLRLAEAHANVRDLLRAEGLEEQVGYFGRYLSVDRAILESEQPGSASFWPSI